MSSDLLHQRIEAFIRQNRNDIVRDIKRLVDIESVRTTGDERHPYGTGYAMVLEEARKIGRELGFSIQNYDGYCSSLSVGPTDQEIGFFTHLDVVPALDGWTYPPFDATETDGYLVGRGTLDNKGPTVIVMYAMKCLQELGLLRNYGVKLVMGCNEGCGTDGLLKYKESVTRFPAISLVADSMFPVCYAEKGCITFTIKRPLSSGRILRLSSGCVSNMVPGHAMAEITGIRVDDAREMLRGFPVTVEEARGNVIVSAEGVPAHAANPEGSVNAIGVLFRALHDSGIVKEDAEIFRVAERYIREYYGLGLGIQAADETTGRLTHVACMMWVTENNEMALSFNVRYPVCITSGKILDTVTSLFSLDGFSISDVSVTEPVYTSPSSEIVVALTQLYNRIAGDTAEPFYEGRLSYAHAIPNAIAYGPIFPNAPSIHPNQRGKDHVSDESICIEQMLKAIEIYVLAVRELDEILSSSVTTGEKKTSVPYPTVEDIIGRDGLIDATILAGKRSIRNAISGISVLEVAEAAVGKWVLPNQIYLTAFYAIRDNIPMQKVIVKTLASNGCSGLIVCHVGHWIQKLSPEIIDLCDELGLPLIIANPDTSYANIMEPILRKIMWPDTNDGAASRSIRIRSDILEIAAVEESPNVMLQRISGLIRLKCTYLDLYYKCIYTDKPRDMLEKEIDYICSNAYEISHNSINGMFSIWNEESGTKIIAPIRTAANFFGYVILDVNEENKNRDNEYVAELISSLTAVCVMAFSRSGRANEMQEKYMNEYLSDLLTWNFPSEEMAVRRGVELGLNVQNKHEIMTVVFSINSPGSELETNSSLRSYIREKYMPVLEELLHYHEPDSVPICCSDMIVILWDNLNNSLDLKQIGKSVVQLFENDERITAYIGISRHYTKVSEFSIAYSEAATTASLCKTLKCRNKVATWQEMWLFSDIQQQITSRNAKESFEQMLEPLHSYDAQHDARLVETLATLIRSNLDIVQASNLLFIHRNTLLYRKNKIIELLGYSPFEMPYFLIYYTAFQFLFKELD